MTAMRAYIRDLISQNEELTRRLQVLETGVHVKEVTPEYDLSKWRLWTWRHEGGRQTPKVWTGGCETTKGGWQTTKTHARGWETPRKLWFSGTGSSVEHYGICWKVAGVHDSHDGDFERDAKAMSWREGGWRDGERCGDCSHWLVGVSSTSTLECNTLATAIEWLASVDGTDSCRPFHRCWCLVEDRSPGVQAWYQAHMLLSPLEWLQHGHEVPTTLNQTRWQRIERRMSTMILQAVPDQIRDELVSSRRMTVFAIITHLYVVYCPGGISEKQNPLKNLQDPPEVSTFSESPAALRKWLRWRQRATEIGATTPDPTLLVRGLVRMTRRVLESDRELQFRLSLARHQVRDASLVGVCASVTHGKEVPWHRHSANFGKRHQVRDASLVGVCASITNGKEVPSSSYHKYEVKVKSMDYEKEESKGKGKGKDKSSEEEKGWASKGVQVLPHDRRLSKGKWYSHAERDGKRRCYTCGSTKRMAPECPRKPSSEGSPPKQKIAKAEGDQAQGGGKGSEDQGGEAETMKGLIWGSQQDAAFSYLSFCCWI